MNHCNTPSWPHTHTFLYTLALSMCTCPHATYIAWPVVVGWRLQYDLIQFCNAVTIIQWLQNLLLQLWEGSRVASRKGSGSWTPLQRSKVHDCQCLQTHWCRWYVALSHGNAVLLHGVLLLGLQQGVGAPLGACLISNRGWHVLNARSHTYIHTSPWFTKDCVWIKSQQGGTPLWCEGQ